MEKIKIDRKRRQRKKRTVRQRRKREKRAVRQRGKRKRKAGVKRTGIETGERHGSENVKRKRRSSKKTGGI